MAGVADSELIARIVEGPIRRRPVAMLSELPYDGIFRGDNFNDVHPLDCRIAARHVRGSAAAEAHDKHRLRIRVKQRAKDTQQNMHPIIRQIALRLPTDVKHSVLARRFFEHGYACAVLSYNRALARLCWKYPGPKISAARKAN